MLENVRGILSWGMDKANIPKGVTVKVRSPLSSSSSSLFALSLSSSSSLSALSLSLFLLLLSFCPQLFAYLNLHCKALSPSL